jgi:IS30 family transposase
MNRNKNEDWAHNINDFGTFYVVMCVVPTYLPKKTLNQRSELIIEYFKLGFKYTEILGFLLNKHEVLLSMRQLYRFLKKFNLKRRGLQLYSH